MIQIKKNEDKRMLREKRKKKKIISWENVFENKKKYELRRE